MAPLGSLIGIPVPFGLGVASVACHGAKSQGRRFYQNIADHLVRGHKLIITPEWSRRPIHILDLADRSIRKAAAVKAKYP